MDSCGFSKYVKDNYTQLEKRKIREWRVGIREKKKKVFLDK